MIRSIDKFLSYESSIALFFISFIFIGIIPFFGLSGVNLMKENMPYSIISVTPFFIVVFLLIMRIGYSTFWAGKIIYYIKNNPEVDNWNYLLLNTQRAFTLKTFCKRFKAPVRAGFVLLEMMERTDSLEKYYISRGIQYDYKFSIPKNQTYLVYYKPKGKN